jgi:gas vesicle protein
MNPLIIEGIITVGIAAAFGGAMWYLVTHNPNYEPKELLKKPWKIFDLIDHAKDNVTEGLKKIKQETQEAIDTTKQIRQEVKEVVKQVQDTVAEVKDDIKELGDKK